MGDLMARPLHPLHHVISSLISIAFLCVYITSQLVLLYCPCPFLCLLFNVFVIYTDRNPCHPYHCLINWTNVSCSVCPRFQIMLDALVLNFSVFFSCLNVLQKLAFHLQTACTFSKSILKCIHKVAKVTVSYIVFVSLFPSVCTEQLDSHWADFCEIWYWNVCIKIYQNSHWVKLGKNNHHFT